MRALNVKSSTPIVLAFALLQPACLSAPDASQYGTHVAALSIEPSDPGDDGGSGDSDPPPPSGGTETPCTNTAVVYISENGAPDCTGVLLASDIVLTAAHCVYVGPHATLLPTVLTVGQAPHSCATGDTRVLNGEANPAYDPTIDGGNAANDSHDLAVLRLASPMPGVSTASLSTSAAAVGAAVTAVGYGYHQEPNTVDGERRCYPGTVTASSGGVVNMSNPQSIGWGSSGGPVFLAGTSTVVGTLSTGTALNAPSGTPGTSSAAFDPAYVAAAIARLRSNPGPGCTAGQTMPCRPDGAACLANGLDSTQGVCHYGTSTCTTAGVFGACVGYVGPSPEVCGNGLDDDCDGQVDEGCTTGGGGGPCDGNPDPCCGSSDPCCGNPDPCCGSANECCGSTDPCCGNPDPCCGVSCGAGEYCVDGGCRSDDTTVCVCGGGYQPGCTGAGGTCDGFCRGGAGDPDCVEN